MRSSASAHDDDAAVLRHLFAAMMVTIFLAKCSFLTASLFEEVPAHLPDGECVRVRGECVRVHASACECAPRRVSPTSFAARFACT